RGPGHAGGRAIAAGRRTNNPDPPPSRESGERCMTGTLEVGIAQTALSPHAPGRCSWLWRVARNPHAWFLGAFSVLYLFFSLQLASLKLLWYDELFTY